MAYHVPFTEEEYVPHSITGNRDAAAPVRFWLSAPAGPDLARLKSIIFATGGLGQDAEWTEQLARDTAAAFVHGADVFVKTVDRIEGLTVPAAMAIKAGLLQDDPKTPIRRDTPIAIDTGAKFARVCGWLTLLAFEISLEVARLSREVDADPRFFGSPTTSPKTATATSGSAPSAAKRRGPRGIAASVTSEASEGQTSGR